MTDSERDPLACRCSRCIAPFDCPTCNEIGGLCKACEDHYAALADAYEADAREAVADGRTRP